MDKLNNISSFFSRYFTPKRKFLFPSHIESILHKHKVAALLKLKPQQNWKWLKFVYNFIHSWYYEKPDNKPKIYFFFVIIFYDAF